MNEKKKTGKSLNRRDFIRTTAAGVGAATLTGLVSNKVGAQEKSQAIKWDHEADVVVLGYGGSGIVAAIEAADGGATVLALEKSPISGGCTKISGCNITSTDNVDGLVEYLKATIGQNNVSDAVIRAVAKETERNPKWLASMGITYEASSLIPNEFPGAPGLEHAICGGVTGSVASNTSGKGASGATMCDTLVDQAKARGVKVLYNTPARELIQHPETREIIGAKAESEGKEIFVKAKRAVVLCTGPFDFNDEMVRNYLRPYPMKFAGWIFNTGDGIPMATKVGARLWHMNGICGYYCPWFEEGKSGYLTFGALKPSWMFCDKYGRRFADESRLMEHNFWKNFTEVDESGVGYARNPGWIVFDETARKAGPVAQSRTSWLPEELGGASPFSQDNSGEIAKGWILKGDTLEKLAEKTGMDAGSLKDEIDHINKAVAESVPDRFGRGQETVWGKLGAWDEGPYYAMRLYAGGTSTMGGPERNEKGQVVGWDGNPIPRLYEAGALGSIWGDHYGPAGANVGISVLAGGRIAGRHAAAEKPWG